MTGSMFDKVEFYDVPENFREMAEILGMEAFKRLVDNYGGVKIYVPVRKCLTRSVRNRILKATFSGDYKQSAREYRVSESYARKIIKGYL